MRARVAHVVEATVVIHWFIDALIVVTSAVIGRSDRSGASLEGARDGTSKTNDLLGALVRNFLGGIDLVALVHRSRLPRDLVGAVYTLDIQGFCCW